MEIDAGILRTFIWIGLLFGTGIGTFLVSRYKTNALIKAFEKYQQDQKEQHIKEETEAKARFDEIMMKVSGIGSSMDKRKDKEDTRYRKISMAMVGLAMALPEGNPHGTDVKKLVDSLAKGNGG